MKEIKKQLRQEMLELRAGLDKDYVLASDASIAENVINSEWFKAAKVIFCFVSMEGEVNTAPILEAAMAEGKIVCVPKVISKGKMEAFVIESLDDFELSSFGIKEPKEGSRLVDPQEIDLGIIPNIVVSSDGYRLGYGGGFYDRYLLRTDMKRLAVCRQLLIQESLPVEPHDIKMDAIVSENGLVHL